MMNSLRLNLIPWLLNYKILDLQFQTRDEELNQLLIIINVDAKLFIITLGLFTQILSSTFISMIFNLISIDDYGKK